MPSARGTKATRDKEAEIDTNHMGFAVSRRGARAAAKEIARFVEEIESRESQH